MIEFTYEQQWMLKEWGEATIEVEGALRQVHYTLKLFRLVRYPIEVTCHCLITVWFDYRTFFFTGIQREENSRTS